MVFVETLTTEWMIPLRTNSPLAKVTTQLRYQISVSFTKLVLALPN